MDLLLHEKCCVVTGGTRNLGRAIVLGLLREGANVIATYRQDSASASELRTLVPQTWKTKLHICREDVSLESACRRVADLALEIHGRFDVLINNAATTLVQHPDAISDTNFNWVLRNTLRSNIYMSRAAFRVMRRRNGGRIVNMSTAGVYTANPMELLYLCAKAGVEASTRAFARLGAQHKRNKVTVNAVAAHVISSGMGLHTMETDPTIIERIPLHRMGRIDELVSLVLYLSSPVCEYMTGQVVHLNGGRLMQ